MDVVSMANETEQSRVIVQIRYPLNVDLLVAAVKEIIETPKFVSTESGSLVLVHAMQ